MVLERLESIDLLKITIMNSFSDRYNIPIVNIGKFCLMSQFESTEVTQEIRNCVLQSMPFSSELMKKVFELLYKIEVNYISDHLAIRL